MKLSKSLVTQHQFNDLIFYIKRDDLLHYQFSGNKARKFMSLFKGDFPNIKKLISYGSAQANSLYSLAALCSMKQWQFIFFVDHIPSYVKNNPIGNYREALNLGANIIDLSQTEDRNDRHPAKYIEDNYSHYPDTLLIPEGGRSPLAELGIKELAHEILHWKQLTKQNNLTIALPSGTGTTALFLQKHLKQANIEVLTCACVGDQDYLIKQFHELDKEATLPTILGVDKKHHFGKLDQKEYQLWQTLKEQTQIEFDLLYDPFMWRCLLKWIPKNPNKTLLYIHQGGILGNESMIKRYQRTLNAHPSVYYNN